MRLIAVGLVALVCGAVVLGACGDSPDDGAVAPTSAPSTATEEPPTATLTPPAPATATVVPPATETPTPGVPEVPSSVRLVEAATGEVTTLYQEIGPRVGNAAFVEGGVALYIDGKRLLVDFDGSLVRTETYRRDCTQLDGAAEIAGRTYNGVNCGTLSPDGRWMAYLVEAGEFTFPSGGTVPMHDQRVLDLRAGDTRLVEPGLIHCGGCDFRYDPLWSATGRYVVFSEFGSDGRRFLSDMESGETRAIGTGNQFSEAPVWSPVADVLIYSSPIRGRTIVEELKAGTVQELELEWPVAFDPSGELLYSPAWSPGGKNPPTETTIVNVADGTVVATLSGIPPSSFLWTRSAAVGASPEGLIVVLQDSDGCAGTAIYVGISLRTCVVDGAEGQVGPDGSIAVAIEKGVGFERSQTNYDIQIVDADGGVTTVVTNAPSFVAPLMVWNAEGTHLLVLWPRSIGI